MLLFLPLDTVSSESAINSDSNYCVVSERLPADSEAQRLRVLPVRYRKHAQTHRCAITHYSTSLSLARAVWRSRSGAGSSEEQCGLACLGVANSSAVVSCAGCGLMFIAPTPGLVPYSLSLTLLHEHTGPIQQHRLPI